MSYRPKGLNTILRTAALCGVFSFACSSALAESVPAAESPQSTAQPISVHPELVSAEARAKSKLRRMLKMSGLDPELIIAQVEKELSAAGGPFTPYPADPKVAEAQAAEADRRFSSLVATTEKDDLILAAVDQIPFAEPVIADGRYSSGFGRRKDPVNGELSLHSGLDFAAPKGTPILAPADGVVIEAERKPGYGETIQIRHEFGLETVYAHLNQIRVEPGQYVRRGEKIGDIGSTGRSTGSHLHYEIRLDGTALNPMKFIEAGRDVYEEQD